MTEEASTWRTGAGVSNGQGSVRGKALVRGGASASKRGAGSARGGGQKRTQATVARKVLPNQPEPFHNLEYFKEYYYHELSGGKVKQMWVNNPKSPLQNYVQSRFGTAPKYSDEEGYVMGRRESTVRSQVIADEEYDVVGYGDAANKKDAEKLAALDALLQLARRDLLNAKPSAKKVKALTTKSGDSGDVTPTNSKEETAILSDGSVLKAERAREFMTFYCTHFRFGMPDITMTASTGKYGKKTIQKGWDAEMRVGGAMIGKGSGSSKKSATSSVYLDTVVYLEKYDPSLWTTFKTLHKPGDPITMASPVIFTVSDKLNDDVRQTFDFTRATNLFANRPRMAGRIQAGEAADASGRATPTGPRKHGRGQNYKASEGVLKEKSDGMLKNLEDYLTDPRMKALRLQRFALPVQQMASDVLVKVELNQVCVVMAATGSGKTTQLPQMILDDFIMQGQGAKCNIVVTQPRRIAAISVAQRVAKERGESIGQTVGYAVRFDQRPASKHGSINFCTTGHFLRRLQSSLTEDDQDGYLDNVSHIIIDEVHERDIETDLLLIILRRIMAERKKQNKSPFKVVLMSATIDPTLFCQYFADPATRLLAPVVEVPGRSFEVSRHYLDETYARLQSLRLPRQAGGWVWEEKNVRQYLEREMSLEGLSRRKLNDNEVDGGDMQDSIDTLELPYPLIALMIADVVMESDEGHILVFLPGWEEIKSVRAILEDTSSKPMMGIDFNNYERFEVHVLHSSVPVEEQQAIFEPIRHAGIRRIILATNIAETSVTIPDVVYVIDSGKSKETHYDPDRHLQSLVAAWVGTSNVNQRAGRAGRHRAGHAYSLMTKARYASLKPSSMVAMKRENLSNIVMNIKAMNIAGIDVEEVLAEAIEPPAPERVRAAVEQLMLLGALDGKKELTSLGQVLAKMPTDAPIAKMCLYGAFFRCLDSTLTLAAILTERSPWVMAEAIRTQAIETKDSWSNPIFRSDALTTLRAFNQFESLTKRGPQYEVGKFCSNNFLHRGAMQTILQIKEQLFETMRAEGILNAVLSQNAEGRGHRGIRPVISMPELNIHSTSLPLLTALLAMSSTPKFAMRIKEKTFRTSQDKTCFLDQSSVNHPKFTNREKEYAGEKDLYAFQAKTTSNAANKSPPMLRGVTKLDPLTFMLFGANQLQPSQDGGMICDGWLPIKGDFGALDDVERLKNILDVVMLRVFEAIEPESTMTHGGGRGSAGTTKNLTGKEIQEFETLTKSLVGILEQYSEERCEEEQPSKSMISKTTTPQYHPKSIGLLSSNGHR
ncbi:hypothetical protein CBS101457_004191 [Exobasidium rhododendri]|nr:hypothetical protein CBS101457_004191 [Exobasidium rhododendri]